MKNHTSKFIACCRYILCGKIKRNRKRTPRTREKLLGSARSHRTEYIFPGILFLFVLVFLYISINIKQLEDDDKIFEMNSKIFDIEIHFNEPN